MNYEKVARQLTSAEVESGAAESHGLLCGLLCAGKKDADRLWIQELFSDRGTANLLVEECKRFLKQIYEDTQEAINGPGLGFTPLLPDDEQPIIVRATAVSEWCQGFLYGVGVAGISPERQLSDETREALNDLAEITRMDHASLDDSEETNDALLEVTEFLWVAAMLVHEEMVDDPTERS